MKEKKTDKRAYMEPVCESFVIKAEQLLQSASGNAGMIGGGAGGGDFGRAIGKLAVLGGGDPCGHIGFPFLGVGAGQGPASIICAVHGYRSDGPLLFVELCRRCLMGFYLTTTK